MDNLRLVLVALLVFIGLLLYQAWEKDYGPTSNELAGIEDTPTSSVLPDKSEQPVVTTTASHNAEIPQTAQDIAELPASQETVVQSTQRIHVKTDVLQLEIDTRGGDIRRTNLLEYPLELGVLDKPFPLMNDRGKHLFILQSGLLAKEGKNAPTHQSDYHSAQTEYTLTEGQDSFEVKLTWSSGNGVNINKIYTFRRGAYAVNLRYEVENNSTQNWQGRVYGQLQRTAFTGIAQSKLLYTYLGGAVATATSRYEKVNFDDIQSGEFNQEWETPWANGWLAMLQHYFVAAIVPEAQGKYKYYSKFLPSGERYMLGLYGQQTEIAPQQKQSFEMTLYAGPKLQHRLEKLSPGLELTVDYGFLWFIAQPLFWLLEKLHALFGNWGWAIIAVTVLIKAGFFRLSAASYRSMANMRRIHPRLLQLKERYGDDRAGLNKAMMDMYKREKVNPLGGCLPVLIQIPVFIALYWTLLESVELRQAPFMGWIQDMSQPDPYFVLPLIMGVTMVIQQKLNPSPLDPIQQKVMMILPIVFTVFFAFFPSGLVLYWVVNNALSITQQWYITRQIEAQGLTSK